MVREYPALVITGERDLSKTAGIPHLRTLICARVSVTPIYWILCVS